MSTHGYPLHDADTAKGHEGDGVRRLAECIGQMDAGQRGKGVSFDEVPHVMARICAGCMLMELSGALDSLAVDDG